MPRRDQRIFYATPYPPKTIKSYLPDQTSTPTPLLAIRSNDLSRHSTRSSGNCQTFRTVRQGLRSVSHHHDYAYGKSRRALRPAVLDDDAWLMSIDTNYRPSGVELI